MLLVLLTATASIGYLSPPYVFAWKNCIISVPSLPLQLFSDMIFVTSADCDLCQVVNVEGTWRVGGLLALSRAFGDVYLKE